MPRNPKQPTPDAQAEEKQALLEKLHQIAAQDQAQRYSRKTANAAIQAMRDDPKAALAFLQECGIYDENGQLAPPYR